MTLEPAHIRRCVRAANKARRGWCRGVCHAFVDKYSLVFTARRYASAVCRRVFVCPAVRLSVRLSQAGIVSKPLNTESRKQRHKTKGIQRTFWDISHGFNWNGASRGPSAIAELLFYWQQQFDVQQSVSRSLSISVSVCVHCKPSVPFRRPAIAACRNVADTLILFHYQRVNFIPPFSFP